MNIPSTLIAFVLAATVAMPTAAFAQTPATAACAGVTGAPSTPVDGVPDGSAKCTQDYTSCINAQVSQSTCAQYATQEGQSWNTFARCSQANPNDPSCTQYEVAAGQAQQNIQDSIDTAVETRANQTIQTNTNPQTLSTQPTQGQKLTYTPLEPLPGYITGVNGQTDISSYISSVFTILFVLGGLFAVVLIIIGGITYMASEVSIDGKGKAKKRIQNALWGLLLLIGSFIILHTINPQFINLNTILDPTAGLPVNPSSSGGTQPNSPGAGPGSAQDQQCQASSSSGQQCYLAQQPDNSYACTCGAL